ncbi:MAG: ATP-dependent DNA helicase RecG [Clostridium perfringens]|nr:ATP-dependent DNA helicase RecG [Clostridium perfringens]
MDIYSDISNIEGVGGKTREKFNKMGIFTILDLLLYFPRDYTFLSKDILEDDSLEKGKSVLKCRVERYLGNILTRTGKRITTIEFLSGDKKILGKWFNSPYITKRFIIGEEYNLLGVFKKVSNNLEVINPIVSCDDSVESSIMAIYKLKDNIKNSMITRAINKVLDKIVIEENLPKCIIEKYKLLSLNNAIREIHFPKDKGNLDKAIERLKFQELFTYSLKLMMLKNRVNGREGIAFKIFTEELKDIKESLPYTLTNAQNKVIKEVLIDEKKHIAMNRLVQGDVGCGKTLVALIALFNVYKNNYQCAFMAPTEILAMQHFNEAKKLFQGFNVNIALLTGSTKKKDKEKIKEIIKDGKPIIVVGTHALIEDDVEFKNLGLIVTDEQHRFGVEQRSRLINKNKICDVLVMTATPIPRTISLYLYSDLEISIINEMPPGRKKIETILFNKDTRENAYKTARDEINKGRQVYIVAPLIEENEKLKLNSVEMIYEKLKKSIFCDISIEILHGKMTSKEKNDIINRFKEGDIKAIISTTVIEVGVNVPNASIMIIENAERFGLAQLHQLRGRVGRGEYNSKCLLISDTKNSVTKKRMDIMTKSSDGFYIAEEDFKLRGSGEIFGIKQHGDDEFILSNVLEDINILRCANKEAKEIVKNQNEENKKICYEISKGLERTSKYICFN